MYKENKVSRMPSQTIRMPQEDMDYITKIGRKTAFNEGVRRLVEIVRSIEAQGLAEIIDVFEPNEWLFMLNVIKPSKAVCDKNELVRLVANPKTSVALAPLYDVNIKVLAEKLSVLGGHQVFALVERINDFYMTEGADKNDWANF